MRGKTVTMQANPFALLNWMMQYQSCDIPGKSLQAFVPCKCGDTHAMTVLAFHPEICSVTLLVEEADH